jgi:hypothetical protein
LIGAATCRSTLAPNWRGSYPQEENLWNILCRIFRASERSEQRNDYQTIIEKELERIKAHREHAARKK